MTLCEIPGGVSRIRLELSSRFFNLLLPINVQQLLHTHPPRCVIAQRRQHISTFWAFKMGLHPAFGTCLIREVLIVATALELMLANAVVACLKLYASVTQIKMEVNLFLWLSTTYDNL
jgi:hypothetical protein